MGRGTPRISYTSDVNEYDNHGEDSDINEVRVASPRNDGFLKLDPSSALNGSFNTDQRNRLEIGLGGGETSHVLWDGQADNFLDNRESLYVHSANQLEVGYGDDTGMDDPGVDSWMQSRDGEDPNDLQLLQFSAQAEVYKRKADKEQVWALVGYGILAMFSIALGLGLLLWVLLTDHTASNIVVANWTMMVGDEVLRSTFMALVATTMAEFDQTEQPNVFYDLLKPPMQHPEDAMLRDAALICYTNRTCDFFGGWCTHFQGACINDIKPDEDHTQFCEYASTYADSEPQCPLQKWEEFVAAARGGDVQFVLSYHWVVRAMSRHQPGTMQEYNLQREPKFAHLDYHNATNRLGMALPETVVLNGCIHYFFANDNYTFDWHAETSQELMHIFAESVRNNIRIFRASKYEGPIVYQGCSPLSCHYLNGLYSYTDGSRGMHPDICEGMNFVGRQANKRLLTLFRAEALHLGDVRYADVDGVMAYQSQHTCDGRTPACFSLEDWQARHGGSKTMAGFDLVMDAPDLFDAYNATTSLAPRLAYLTLSAAMPRSLLAAPKTCPCTVDAYNGYDLSMDDVYYV